MKKTFFRLGAGRQDGLLKVCAREFGENGYEASSTNRIVQAANISKGLFFKYFDSKESLYLFLVKKVMEELGELQRLGFDSPDIVHRSEELFSRHMAYAQQHPAYYRLAILSAFETAPAIQKKIHAIRSEISALFLPHLYDGVDWDLYRLPKEQVMEFLSFVDIGLRHAAIAALGDGSDTADFKTVVRDKLRLTIDVLTVGLYARPPQKKKARRVNPS